ncbi:MAG: DegT/DnrJ/EryC1/StrS family aminotransferase [Phycisphaerales bacterium]|nr:MAG: DegT/DnrJ/EryC1/StrS family aminotransferase [Phycisphaerales bacterium]
MCVSELIALSVPDLTHVERDYLLEAFDSSWISSKGRFVAEFERRFAEFVGTEHAVSCTNGTAALHLALKACGVGPSDEVILPDLTYVSTANAVRYVDAQPVLADCDPDTWNMAPESVARLVTKQTKAIIAVHLLAVPADLEALRRIADEARCLLIEDAAEAPGARWAGMPAGSVGDASTFSFYGNKILTTGEGGMVCCHSEHLAARLRKLRGQAAHPDRHYWFDEVGYNYRMTNLACAIGLAQLSRFREIADKRAEVRSWYDEAFADIGDLVRLQVCPRKADPGWWMIGVVLDASLRANRDTVRERLQDAGIETRPFFAALSSLPIYEGCRTDNGSPVARFLGDRGIMLPTHTKLRRGDVSRVVDTLIAAIHQPVEMA